MHDSPRDALRRFAGRVLELEQTESRLLAELEAVRSELDKLGRLVEPHLTQFDVDGGEEVAVEPATLKPGSTLTVEDIRTRSLGMLRQSGPVGLKAIQIAKQLVPGYEQDDDERVFENRVFAALKRDRRFGKNAEGLWVLAEFATDTGNHAE